MNEQRRAGLDKMTEVYGFDVSDGPGDFFSYTVEHLFGDVWQREGLSLRDRRLLISGMLIGSGQEDVLDVQIPASLDRGDLDAAAWREIVIFVAHYAGWPRGARLNNKVEAAIAAHESSRRESGD